MHNLKDNITIAKIIFLCYSELGFQEMGKNNLFSSEIEMIGIPTQIPFDGEDYLYRQLEILLNTLLQE